MSFSQKRELLYLHQDGEDIRNFELKSRDIVLGDILFGLTSEDETLLNEACAMPVSVGHNLFKHAIPLHYRTAQQDGWE